MNADIPEGLDKAMSKKLLEDKEKMITSIYTQLMQMEQMQGKGQFDMEKTILRNKTVYDDEMYIKTQYSAKDL